MKRERFEEIIKILNDAKIYDIEEDSNDLIADDEWDKNFKIIAWDLNVDRRIHYETSERIWKVGEWYMGERYVRRCNSEMNDVKSIGVTAKFYEMERVEKVVEKVTYQYIKKQEVTK